MAFFWVCVAVAVVILLSMVRLGSMSDREAQAILALLKKKG